MSLRFLRLCLATGLTLVSLSAQTPPAGTPLPAVPVAAEDELVGPIKLPDADIDTVLGLLEIYTGRVILRPQQLPTATYHLVIDKKIPKSEAVLALQTVLSLNQVGVVPLGDKFLKVVALAQAKTEAPEMITGSTLDLPPSGRIAAKLFQLQFLRVNEFVPHITPLMTPGVANGIVALDKANAVLITDTLSNLQRVETLINQLDQPSMAGLTPKFYPLRNGAKASDIVAKIHAMFQGPLQAQLGAATSYSADDRSNQVIVLADSRQLPLFDQLIAKLDVKADPNTRNEVIFLKHASAKDVAPLLSQLVSGQTSAAQKSGSVNRVQPVAPNHPPAAGQPPAAATAAVATAESTNEFSNFLTILPDERSNSIVVSGTVDDIRLLHNLVDKLDVLLAQVSIQVVIAEVTLSDSDVNGISALGLNVETTEGGRGTHVKSFDPLSVAGWNITKGVVNPLSFSAMMSDVGQKSNVKVLSANTIVTTHNKEAEFVVSDQLPVITNYVATPTSSNLTADNPFASTSQVTYKDIGIDVKVTPLIGDDGSIQLKIDQKVDNQGTPTIINGNSQPTINHRQATSFINVRDGQMVVLGGLQQRSSTASRKKLGFLYEIPILSNLLGGRNNDTKRTELLLFVRPHVIPADEGTKDARANIDSLSSKKEVDQFLKDPSKETHKKLLDKYYK
jgi:general secretion pathway protein D